MVNTDMNWGHDQQYIAQERVVLKEWDYLQHALFNFALAASRPSAYSRRSMIEDYITQITGRCARIWWEPYIPGSAAEDSRLFEIRYQHIRYGMLELASRYLESKLQPGMAQNFAHLCALILALAEHEELVGHQLLQLSPLYTKEPTKLLTARERDVLQGLVGGESESEMAHRLGIEPTTVHTHLQRLYRRLEVHNPREAVLRSFVFRLVDWLNLPRRKN